MRGFLITALVSFLFSPAWAADQDSAKTLCNRIAQEHPLPPRLHDKILLTQTGEPSQAMFFDMSYAEPTDTEALADFDRALAPCRAAMLAVLEARSTKQADERRALFSRNEKILFDLMARKFSFGEANRQWDNARIDFEARAAQLAAAATTLRVADDVSAGNGAFNLSSGVSCATKNQC